MTESVAKIHRMSKLPVKCCECQTHRNEDWTAHDFLARRGLKSWLCLPASLCHSILTQCIPGGVTSLPCNPYKACFEENCHFSVLYRTFVSYFFILRCLIFSKILRRECLQHAWIFLNTNAFSDMCSSW